MTEKRKVRVVLADDEAHVRLYVKTVVKSMGCEVVGEAGNGREMLEAVARLRPELVLLDINMPVMDGISALKALRAKSDKVAIVMLTSLASADIVQECLDAGANYHLRKDLSMKELKEEIRDTWLAHLQDQREAP